MMTPIWIKGLIGLGIIGAIAYLGMCIALWFVQKQLIFVPSRQISYTPDALGLNYEEVWIPLLTLEETVERLHGWWLPGKRGLEEVILYLHGNGGNISSNLAHVKVFNELGFSVLMIDYRGYGQSDGKFPSEAQVYKDAQVAWDYLIHQKAVKPENIFIFGHSLGGAIAIDLAVRKPNAAGLIVESSFTSIQEMVDLRRFYRIFPVSLFLHQRFDSLSKLRLLRVPLLLIHGTEDRTVPPSMGQTLFEKADVPKKLYIVPLAGHNNVSSVGDERYKEEIAAFRQFARQNKRQYVRK